MRRTLIEVLTYLSLLASIGSFMISALPLLPELDCTACAPRKQVEQRPAGQSGAQTEPVRRKHTPTRREMLIAICFLVIIGGTTGIVIIRLLRQQRK